MADINKTININVNAGGADNQLDDLTKKLGNVDNNTTKVTQSTNLNTRSLDSNRKSILENGGAMGLLGAATGGLAMDFKDAVEAIDGAGIKLKGLNGIIAGSLIGAFAIIMLQLITNFDKWNDLLTGAKDRMDNFNASLLTFNNYQKTLKTSLDSTIASLENELAILEAQGAAQDVILKKTNEINDAKKNYYTQSIPDLEKEIALLEQAVDLDDERNKIQKEIILNTIALNSADKETRDNARQDLITAKSRLLLYDEENNTVKLLKTKQDELSKAKIDRNKVETDSEVNKLKEQKRLYDLDTQNFIDAQDKKLNKSKNLFNEGVNLLKQSIELAKQTTAATSELYGGNLSQIATNIILSNKLWYDNQTSFRDFNKSLAISQSENAKILSTIQDKYNKLISDAKNNNQDTTQLEKEKSAALEEQNKIYDENFTKLLRRENIDKEVIKNYQNNAKTIKEFNEYSRGQYDTDLQFKEKIKLSDFAILVAQEQLIDLQTKLFNFEKDNGSLGLDNSTKYLEINERLNDESEYRLLLIRRTAEEQELQSNNELQNLKNNLKFVTEQRILAEIEFNEKKSKVEKGQLTVLDDEYVNAALKRNELNVKELDAIQKIEDQKIAMIRNQDDVEIMMYQETADTKFQIEANLYQKEKELRDERLEREQLYYGAVMGIAGESANFLDALINNGHLRDKKAAENALALRKVIGVASVVIAGQEEIRGIWANPSLSALPDTGVVSKTLLTAAAVARGGLSIATILAQKLSGGGSMGTGSAGAAAPQASFNVVGSSSNNQLAATIAAQQQKPVKSYVIGADVSTQQALDRAIQKNATFL